MASKFEVFSEKFNRGVQVEGNACFCTCENWIHEGWGNG